MNDEAIATVAEQLQRIRAMQAKAAHVAKQS